MSSDSISLHRHELYNLVWSVPMSSLAQKYGFSDVWLAKICKKYNIPRPSRGYWARKRAGEKISITSLPKRRDDPIIDISIYPKRPEKEKANVDKLSIGPITKNITVPDALTDPHPLIKEAAKILANAKADETGLLVPPQKQCLDIRVSKDFLDRALRIMDTLIKVLLKVGFDVSSSEGSAIVSIYGVSLGIRICEGLKRRRISASELNLDGGYYQFGYNLYADRAVPSGVLSLLIDDKVSRYHMASRKAWRDTETKRLENCLNSFVSGLIKTANIKYSLKQKKTTPTHTPEDSAGNETSEHI